MFDLRYHVASLAAVFLALIIGVLLGIGVADRGPVKLARERKLEERIEQLRGELAAARDRLDARADEDRAAAALIRQAYPVLMEDRLRDKRIAVAFVGSVDGPVDSSVQLALADAGAPGPVRVRALRLPVDAAALRSAALGARPALVRYVGPRRLDDLGRALGEEFVDGGRTPLWDAFSGQLVDERRGNGNRPADAVVVARSTPTLNGATARFVRGFYSALAASDVPTVGVETQTAERSSVPSFRRAGFSTVDGVDTPTGRLALVLLLGGAPPGNYGVKRTADDGILPPIEPVPQGGAVGG